MGDLGDCFPVCHARLDSQHLLRGKYSTTTRASTFFNTNPVDENFIYHAICWTCNLCFSSSNTTSSWGASNATRMDDLCPLYGTWLYSFFHLDRCHSTDDLETRSPHHFSRYLWSSLCYVVLFHRCLVSSENCYSRAF